MKKNETIAIIGLGYVGLPLAVEFAKFYNVIGFDINEKRILELKKGNDSTGELSHSELNNVSNIFLTNSESILIEAQIFIVTVPTPIDGVNKPDFTSLKEASKIVGKALKKGSIVVFESTVYPGATNEICLPILEKISRLKYNIDFGIGYSPERINPGDKSKSIRDIVKVTSGSNEKTADKVDSIYKKIIKAGTHRTKKIEIAEAAKVIENTQRDINIALMNELSIICNKLNISTKDVLEAAGTKWNFINLKPGLVGGHCIGVDPYYLTEKALQLGYKPELILAGRRINDSMPKYIVDEFLKFYLKKNFLNNSKKVLLMGITFKEDCPDIRNSKSLEIANLLIDYGFKLDIYDPIADLTKNTLAKFNLIDELNPSNYCAIIIAVPHKEFKNLSLKNIKSICTKDPLIFDIKGIFPKNETSWSL